MIYSLFILPLFFFRLQSHAHEESFALQIFHLNYLLSADVSRGSRDLKSLCFHYPQSSPSPAGSIPPAATEEVESAVLGGLTVRETPHRKIHRQVQEIKKQRREVLLCKPESLRFQFRFDYVIGSAALDERFAAFIALVADRSSIIA